MSFRQGLPASFIPLSTPESIRPQRGALICAVSASFHFPHQFTIDANAQLHKYEIPRYTANELEKMLDLHLKLLGIKLSPDFRVRVLLEVSRVPRNLLFFVQAVRARLEAGGGGNLEGDFLKLLNEDYHSNRLLKILSALAAPGSHVERSKALRAAVLFYLRRLSDAGEDGLIQVWQDHGLFLSDEAGAAPRPVCPSFERALFVYFGQEFDSLVELMASDSQFRPRAFELFFKRTLTRLAESRA